jgi:hypothetical protein
MQMIRRAQTIISMWIWCVNFIVQIKMLQQDKLMMSRLNGNESQVFN